MENKQREVSVFWKILSIVLAFVILLMVSSDIYWNHKTNKIEKETNICYYDICSDYPDAEYNFVEEVCYCYGYDNLGDLIIAETEYMGKK